MEGVIKKMLFPLFSLFLAYRSFELMRILLASKASNYSFTEVFIMAFILSLFITGFFAFIGFAYSSHKLLPERYYKVKRPERLKKVTEIIGLKYFRVLLLFAFWGKKTNRKKYFNGTRQGLADFVYQTKQSEFGHLGALVSIVLLSIPLLIRKYYSLVIIMNIINVIGNFYPVLLQRLHRARIDKVRWNSH